MEKKIYMTPLMEVETISLSRCLLDGSPTYPGPTPPPGPAGQAPRHRTPVF